MEPFCQYDYAPMVAASGPTAACLSTDVIPPSTGVPRDGQRHWVIRNLSSCHVASFDVPSPVGFLVFLVHRVKTKTKGGKYTSRKTLQSTPTMLRVLALHPELACLVLPRGFFRQGIPGWPNIPALPPLWSSPCCGFIHATEECPVASPASPADVEPSGDVEIVIVEDSPDVAMSDPSVPVVSSSSSVPAASLPLLTWRCLELGP